MMKYFFIPVIALLVFSCGQSSTKKITDFGPGNEQPAPDTTHASLNGTNTGVKPGEYFEYYPSGKLKMKGFYNEQVNRDGLWISYYEEGSKWSESYYVDGKRDGHSLTFFPNGEIRYIGEYKNDEKKGSWKFYNEQGALIREEKY